MSYIKTKYNTMWLFSSTLLLGTTSGCLGTGIGEYNELEKQNLSFNGKVFRYSVTPYSVI